MKRSPSLEVARLVRRSDCLVSHAEKRFQVALRMSGMYWITDRLGKLLGRKL